VQLLLHDRESHRRRWYRARAETHANALRCEDSRGFAADIFGGESRVVADKDGRRWVLRARVAANGFGGKANVGEGELVCDKGSPSGCAEFYFCTHLRIIRNMTGKLIVFVTCPGREEGESIARAVVEERLAACVNVVAGVRSCYVWEGKSTWSEEVLLLIKTTEVRFAELQ